MHMQGCANDVHSFGFRYLFNYKAGRNLSREVMQKVSYGIQPWETQFILLTRRFGFTFTQGGLKGEGGAFGCNFAAH